MRNFSLIGQIKGAKAVSRKDKVTGAVTNSCEVIVQYEDYDKNGDLVLDTDSINFDLTFLDKFKSNLNKFVVIPHIFINTPKGTWLLPDEMMNIQFFESNPLIPKVELKKAG